MKKFLSLILALGMVASLAACGGSSSSGDASSDSSTDSSDSAPAASAKLRFVTGGESGTYYAFGSVIAQHATNNAGINVVGLVGNGSQGNVQELVDGTADFAFCQSDVMAYAYNGTNLFKSKMEGFSTVAALYMEQVQIVTTNPAIKTVADLAGKSVSIGAPGSGVYFNAIDVLGAYGLTENDIKPTYQSFGDSADALKNGQIDAAFIVAGAPTTAVTDLATTKDTYLVSLDDEHVTKLLETSDYYTKTVFEFVTTEIGAQGTVCGGGRYDGLIGQLGGADTPALGFAMGLERLLLTMQQQGCNFLETPPCDLYIAPMDAEALPKAMQLAQAVRESGYQAEYDLMHRGLKAQMKYANKIHATYVLVLGGNELEQQSAKLKQMETGEQIAIPLDDRFAEAFDNIAISHMFQNTLQEEA